MSKVYDYSFNWEGINKYILTVSKSDEEAKALKEFFEVTKYVSIDEFLENLKRVNNTFNDMIKCMEYIACLFTIDYESSDNKSNNWVFNLMLTMGLKSPKYIIKDSNDLNKVIDLKLNNFVFFDDAAFSGYQMFDTVYNTLLIDLFERKYHVPINIYILLGYASMRSIDLFDILTPTPSIKIPLEEIPLKFSLKKFNSMKVNLTLIYGEKIKILNELLSHNTIDILSKMGIKKSKVPLYFSHKMPDYISTYSEIYIGFTLEPPYNIIPLIHNCERYYNKELLKTIKTIEDIEDITREAPCPIPPYKNYN